MAVTTDAIANHEALPARAAQTEWPCISLVTPVRNSAKYLEQTIRSVLGQEYPNLEYFVVDGGSSDGSVDIIRKYEKQISGWISEPDQGMYDAINKGFVRTTGEIMGWISATDQLHVNGLAVVGSVFRDLPKVEWITGQPTAFNEDGMTIAILAPKRWSRLRFLAGANRFIQQESTFWRRSLWERAGGRVDSSQRYCADFELWVRFFRYAQIYTVEALIGGYRLHSDSLGYQDLEMCYRLYDGFIEAELARSNEAFVKRLKLFRRISKRVQSIPKIGGVWRRLVMNRLYSRPGRDWPPIIKFMGDKWGFGHQQ